MSEGQVARRDRILDAAAELGARADLERVQMNEVAKDAGVAIGTLYRYFPSKTHLFTAVFEAQLDTILERLWPDDSEDLVSDIGEVLVSLSRELLRRPRLCSAMVQSTATNYTSDPFGSPDGDSALSRAVLHTLKQSAPGEEVESTVRLLVFSWWGVLISRLSGKTSVEQAESDMRLAARLLVGPLLPQRPSR
ncbi:TetR family transcriptional regulator [Saccharopolyspora oryzae]|uniref:TetR family transcriptional regulator n=1 Tax=Saccharopolyspora oryzae TaxID=2997343 RepID=A0ABT4US76_9PSEU|nr:TetR family transcriptional regulator [Saccharopolyspora oryzae]MDA3624568.1 TetR family transcriptional regulator [Saccharopolyspora oryzae]